MQFEPKWRPICDSVPLQVSLWWVVTLMIERRSYFDAIRWILRIHKKGSYKLWTRLKVSVLKMLEAITISSRWIAFDRCDKYCWRVRMEDRTEFLLREKFIWDACAHNFVPNFYRLELSYSIIVMLALSLYWNIVIHLN